MKIKSIIVAHKAEANMKQGGAVNALGIFDNMIQPLFPIPMPHLSIVVTIEGITKPTLFEARICGPTGDLITKGEFTPIVDPFGVGKKIFDLENFLIPARGRYTFELLEKTEGDKFKFISEETLFIAEFPPERPFSVEEINHILSDDSLIKVVRGEFPLLGLKEKVKIQHSLDKSIPLEEGFITIPENNKLVIEDKEFDLLGVRRHLEWMFGRPIPKAPESSTEENKEIPIDDKLN